MNASLRRVARLDRDVEDAGLARRRADTPRARAGPAGGTAPASRPPPRRRPGRSGSATGTPARPGPRRVASWSSRWSASVSTKLTNVSVGVLTSQLACVARRPRDLIVLAESPLESRGSGHTSARSRASRSRRPSRVVGTSMTRMPRTSRSSAAAQLDRRRRPARTRCRSPRTAPRSRPRAACRRRARTPTPAHGAPCSRVAKIAPPSSFATTIVRSGRGSSGPITSPLASCRNVRSPMYASARDDVAAKGRADRRRDRAVDAGEPAVADDQPSLAGRVRRSPSGRGRGPAATTRRRAAPPARPRPRPRRRPAAEARSARRRPVDLGGQRRIGRPPLVDPAVVVGAADLGHRRRGAARPGPGRCTRRTPADRDAPRCRSARSAGSPAATAWGGR